MAGDAIKGHHPANRLKALRLSSDTGLPFSHHVVAGDAHTFIQAVAENSPKCEHHHSVSKWTPSFLQELKTS